MASKTIQKKAMDDPELQGMFNTMMGTSEADPRVITPKYEGLLEDASSIVSIIEKVFAPHEDGVQVPQGLLEDFGLAFADFKQFVVESTSELRSLTIEKKSMQAGASMIELNRDPQKIAHFLEAFERGYDPKTLRESYKSLKECRTINKIIIATRDLRKYVEEDKVQKKKKHHDIEEKDKLSESFIKDSPDDYLQLIPSISKTDFKQVWMHPAAVYKFRNRAVYALHILLKRGSSIVQKIMAPDIDVDKFSEMLVENIDKIRKTVPRCDKAFDKIQQSVDLLKGNFGGYYKDFVISKNPGVIVERFISDVSNSNTADRQTTYQFKKIIQFYQSKMASKPKDPRLDKIFEMLGTNISALEEKTGQTYKGSRSSLKPIGEEKGEEKEEKEAKDVKPQIHDKKNKKEVAKENKGEKDKKKQKETDLKEEDLTDPDGIHPREDEQEVEDVEDVEEDEEIDEEIAAGFLETLDFASETLQDVAIGSVISDIDGQIEDVTYEHEPQKKEKKLRKKPKTHDDDDN